MIIRNCLISFIYTGLLHHSFHIDLSCSVHIRIQESGEIMHVLSPEYDKSSLPEVQSTNFSIKIAHRIYMTTDTCFHFPVNTFRKT